MKRKLIGILAILAALCSFIGLIWYFFGYKVAIDLFVGSSLMGLTAVFLRLGTGLIDDK